MSENVRLEDIDKNMAVGTPDENGIVWFDADASPFDLYGFCRKDPTDPFARLPKDVAAATSEGVLSLYDHTAGGRIRFSTDSPKIAVRMTCPYISPMYHMPMTGIASCDLYLDGERESRFFRLFRIACDVKTGYTTTVEVGAGGHRFYTLHMPLYTPVSKCEIGVMAGSTLGEGRKYLPQKPIVFYGSSITQGGCVSRPGLCYTNAVSRDLGIDHVNLGFSGNGKAEEPMVEYLASLDMSVFVSDYDHNAPNADYLRATHEKMYLAIREKHPDLPYVMISRPDFSYNARESIRRRFVVMETYRHACENGDKNVWYLDGAGFFRGADEDSCTVDGCHPNDLGHRKMADNVERVLTRIFRDRL